MKSLSRNEMKKVMGGLAEGGGANCCAHTQGWGDYQCGYSSSAEAQAAADNYAATNGIRAFYCCDCASSPGYPQLP